MTEYYRPKLPQWLVRRNQEPKKAEKILSGALQKLGLEDKLNKYRFVRFWSEVVGEELARRSKPEEIRNGCLRIRVENSAWVQELTFQKQVILGRVRRLLPPGTSINDIRFFVDGRP